MQNLTPAQRNQLRKRAAQQAAATAPAMSMHGATAYEQQLAQLAQHRARLKQVQSDQGKASLKAQLLPEYVPYVQGVLEAGNGAQDEVLTTVMLWRIDAADYPGALEVADYVIKHGLKMSERFARSTGTLIAEEIAEAALKAQKAGDSFPLEILQQAAELTAEQDMPDQARAKLHLALGKALSALVTDDNPAGMDIGWLEGAKAHLAKAIDLHSNCGGKKDLDRVDRLLKKHAAPPEAPETPEAPEAPETPETPEIPETPETPEAPETPKPRKHRKPGS